MFDEPPHISSAIRQPVILIADDQPIVIRQLHALFKNDFQVFMASGGKECLERCKTLVPDLVLLDISMGDMDGFDVCQRLKDDVVTSHIPIVFITSKVKEEDEIRGFELGAVDFIRKPINPTITWARVQNHVQLKVQADMLRSMALVDGLTGAANRYQLDEQLSTEWQACARDKTPFSLLMIDVDYFKKFNDEHGHLAGDECLKQVSANIQELLNRPLDMLARYGGEEFVCLLPGTDFNGAQHIAEKIRHSVEQMKIRNISLTGVTVTVSIGALTTIPNHQMTATQFLQESDELLYQAKQDGRNRVVVKHLTL